MLKTHDHSQRNFFYFQNNNICQTRTHYGRMPTDRCSCCHKMSAQGCMMSLPVWSYAFSRGCIRGWSPSRGECLSTEGSASRPPLVNRKTDRCLRKHYLPLWSVIIVWRSPPLQLGPLWEILDPPLPNFVETDGC